MPGPRRPTAEQIRTDVRDRAEVSFEESGGMEGHYGLIPSEAARGFLNEPLHAGPERIQSGDLSDAPSKRAVPAPENGKPVRWTDG